MSFKHTAPRATMGADTEIDEIPIDERRDDNRRADGHTFYYVDGMGNNIYKAADGRRYVLRSDGSRAYIDSVSAGRYGFTKGSPSDLPYGAGYGYGVGHVQDRKHPAEDERQVTTNVTTAGGGLLPWLLIGGVAVWALFGKSDD